jgi:CBS domain containing-hemolysin-like protein
MMGVLLTVALLLLVSAYFTCAEAVLLGDPAREPNGREPAGGPSSRERLLAAILLGNTCVNVVLAVLATALGRENGLPLAWLTASLLATMLVVIAGEMLPRELGNRRGVRLASLTRPPANLPLRMLSPAARLLNRASRLLLLAVGLDPHELHPKVASGDLRFLFKTGATGGAMLPEQQRIFRSASSLSERSVREVMVPLTDVKALRSTARARDALDLARATGFTRFPVHGTRLDEILGVLNIYDILHAEFDPEEPLKRFMRAGLYVPNTVAIDRLLFQMQSRKMPLAIVVDEFGAADGVVTINDIVEEVVGAFDVDEGAATGPIQRQADGTYLLDGHVSLDLLNRELNLELPKKSYDTLAGFLMTEMEKIPEEGDRFTFEEMSFEVTKARRHTLQKVLLRIQNEN